ncbi:hypothetical protein IGI04_036240 [Brassica rapa subsp. trilocularis]|uniref:Uncharacterized protein n=1 Tax=Brassica rapa subsp. trilocularis TaxID=1813537 RepID=A0ABQ7LFQ8_BRACM|nr:hypothetical protein IGI04_036240 [Brassica rapa subsp. trilocularis]
MKISKGISSGVITTLVNGQSLNGRSILDDVEIATTCRFLVHLQSKGGPVKIYLWHQTAKDFYK